MALGQKKPVPLTSGDEGQAPDAADTPPPLATGELEAISEVRRGVLEFSRRVGVLGVCGALPLFDPSVSLSSVSSFFIPRGLSRYQGVLIGLPTHT